MNRMTRFAAGMLGTFGLLVAGSLSAFAAVTPPSLGGAANYAVLGGTGVTCTASTVTGNVGSKVSVSQTPTCHISGNITQGASAVGAWNNFVTAYTTLHGLTCPPANNLTGTPLGGMSPAPGVYCFDTTADLTSGTLTLSGSASDVWVFQVGTGITTRGPGQVVMAGGASACNVYWVIGSLATIDTGTKFQGNILAGTAVTFTGTGSSLMGRALAKAEVTMTGTTISGCGGTSAGGGGGGGGGGGDNEDNDHDGDHDNDGNHDGGDHNGGDHNGGDHNGGDHHGGNK